jgi:hypothetical protein
MTVAELLEAIAVHKASFRTVPVGGFREQDRVLWAYLPECPRSADQPVNEYVEQLALVLGLHSNTQEQP